MADRERERTLNATILAEGFFPKEFIPPTLDSEFFPGPLIWGGTPFEIDRLMFVRLVMTAALLLFFFIAMRGARVVPRGVQNVGEFLLDFVRIHIAEEILGKEQAKRFLPLLMTIFFVVLSQNLASIIPFLNISANARVGAPLMLAIVSWIAFNYAGVKKFGFFRFFKGSVVVPNVPVALHVLLIPIEFVSTFILRPFTLTVRLMANMLAGHVMLVLFFSATQFFFFGLETAGWMRVFGAGSLLVGFAFTLFEMMVIFLQAYIFALLAAVYIDIALHAEEH